MIPGSANPLLLATAAPTGYNIERSLRFNSSDSAFCGHTFASAGDRKKWTFSAWVKRSKSTPSAMQVLLAAGSDNNDFGFVFDTDDRLLIYDWNGVFTWQKKSAQVFRDFSAWYHILAVFDTANATAEDRVRLFVNGQRITDWNTNTNPTLDYATNEVNAAQEHRIGRSTANNSRYFDGYLADIHFIDGQALDPTSFGEFSATTGVWMPKAFSGGSYGTNGFKLDFADNSAATAAALGKDTSGNGNNWTPTNLSVTAGAGNDSLIDVPVNGSQTDTGVGGEVRGNYCTWNPLSTITTLSNGNLDCSGGGVPTLQVHGTLAAANSGKWYFEITTTGSSQQWVGIGGAELDSSRKSLFSYGYNEEGRLFINNVQQGIQFNTFGSGAVIGVAYDADASTVRFYKNGVAQGTSATSVVANKNYSPAMDVFSGGGILNAGQRPFAYTAPSGFKALCTANLPEGSITTSGSFTGNANADGPFIWLNGVPTAMTINGNAVTFATHADKLSNGFKVRTSSGSYNTAGSNTYSVSTTGANFKNARAQSNP